MVKNKRYLFSMPDNVYKKLFEAAEQKNVPMSVYMREILIEALKRQVK